MSDSAKEYGGQYGGGGVLSSAKSHRHGHQTRYMGKHYSMFHMAKQHCGSTTFN